MAQLYNVPELIDQCLQLMLKNFEKIRERHFPRQGKGEQEIKEMPELDPETVALLTSRWTKHLSNTTLARGFIYFPALDEMAEGDVM